MNQGTQPVDEMFGSSMHAAFSIGGGVTRLKSDHGSYQGAPQIEGSRMLPFRGMEMKREKRLTE
jgi:hypothetical protein